MTGKLRTILYFRAVWTMEQPIFLEEAVKRALIVMPDFEDTNLPIKTMCAEVRHREIMRRSVKLHIAKWTEGESASIVPHLQQETVEADLGELSPDGNYDYLDGDGMVFISGNHCLIMPSNFHQKSIGQYLRDLIAQARDEYEATIPENVESFELLPIANNNIANRLRREGIKKVHLEVGQYLETAYADREVYVSPLMRIGQSIFDALVMRDEDRHRFERAENLHAKLIITRDGRRMGIEPEDLNPFVQSVIDEEEEEQGILIETSSGHIIKQGDVQLRRKVTVDEFGKTVTHRHAWQLMTNYFQELRQCGMLEE